MCLNQWFGIPLLMGLLVVLAGCASAPPRIAVPESQQDQVVVEGIQQTIRYWGDAKPENLSEMIDANARVKKAQPDFKDKTSINYLALSGGGENGAFGAGLLAGWSERGTRPEFDIVTGVSIGALIAPFAFLGPEYDKELEYLFTSMSMDELIVSGFWETIAGFFGGPAITDTTPLRTIVEQFFDQEVLELIAVEHQKGRRLLIGTTNLDSERPVIWDMGALASSGHPNSLMVFREVMLASSAIPGMMPPVLFNVESEKGRFQELHVDGGVTSQVFIYPVDIDLSEYTEENPFVRNLYIVRNSEVKPQYQATDADVYALSVRSINTLIKNQGVGDLYKMKLISERDNYLYQLAYIGPDFKFNGEEQSGQAYMNHLYQYAFEQAKKGYPWRSSPGIK